MSVRRALVLGAGRMAGGFLAPLLADAGWAVTLVSPTPAVVRAIREANGIRVRAGADDRWIEGVAALDASSHDCDRLAVDADLVITAVGPASLAAAAVRLAPALRVRASLGRPLNVLLLENHRRSADMFVHALVRACPAVAASVGRTNGVGGVAAWRAVADRAVDAECVTYTGDDEQECWVDTSSLVPGVAPLDGSVPGLVTTSAFDLRMLEKLWLFNGGHAAAAYLGRLRGHETLAGAMADRTVAAVVASVVEESRIALAAVAARHHPDEVPRARRTDEILRRYADPALRDSVLRVGRSPRRKLGAGDRIAGPAVACLDAGVVPHALARTAVAALRYEAPTDVEAANLRREVELVGPEEAFATVARLHPRDELSRLVGAEYRRGEAGIAA